MPASSPREAHRRARARSRLRLAASLLGVCLVASVACEERAEITAETDAGAGGVPAELGCAEGLPGARLVRLEASGGEVFCMDQREATWRDYRQFLAARGGDVAGQAPECAWNASFEPAYEVKDDTLRNSDRCDDAVDHPSSPDEPASCLDFCDALAYCEWAGKRLCGRVGGPKEWGRVYVGVTKEQRTPEAMEAFSSLAQSLAMEFQEACTQGGKTKFPYGDELVPGRCIDATWHGDGGAPLPEVADLSTRECHGERGPYADLYDLSGSVMEWGDACSFNNNDLGCMVVGGARNAPKPELLGCASSLGMLGYSQVNKYIGFRCCADAAPVVAEAR